MKRFPGFVVDGKPFFMIGAQAHNSSSYTKEMLQKAADATLALNCNTLEAPVYWDVVEKEEGVFDFSMVDNMLEVCRKSGLRLVILWFASWKNGEMSYCPAYVKRDTKRFQRVITADGVEVTDLCSHSEVNRNQDANAFAHLMAYIKEKDSEQKTVIAMQVQNEPGYLRTDHDYCELAMKDQNSPVPEELLTFIEGRKEGTAYQCWLAQGLPHGKNWFETFGIRGYEYCETWAMSHYIDYVAGKGKEQYDIPMYVNVWLTTTPWNVPGMSYPGGGAIKENMDIWQCAIRWLDMIGPDNYANNTYRYTEYIKTYNLPDNALFMPETHPNNDTACRIFYAIEQGCVGNAIFGAERVFMDDGSIDPAMEPLMESHKVIKMANDLIMKHKDDGRIHAILQHEGDDYQLFDFTEYIGNVNFYPGIFHDSTDYDNNRSKDTPNRSLSRGLIIEENPKLFYLIGNFHLRLAKKKSPDWNLVDRYLNIVDHVSVQEGYFDENGEYVVTRTRNGDELIFGGFWTTTKCGIVRIELV